VGLRIVNPNTNTNTRKETNMNTNGISKETAGVVSAEIYEAVKAIFAKHNLEVSKSTSGHGDWFEFKVVGSPIAKGLNGVNMASKEATYYTKFGYSSYSEDFSELRLTAPLGTKFMWNNREVFFAGIDAAKRKFPIMVIEASTGKTLMLPDAAIGKINLAA
jgi:hypothetical protein